MVSSIKRVCPASIQCNCMHYRDVGPHTDVTHQIWTGLGILLFIVNGFWSMLIATNALDLTNDGKKLIIKTLLLHEFMGILFGIIIGLTIAYQVDDLEVILPWRRKTRQKMSTTPLVSSEARDYGSMVSTANPA